MIGPDSLHYALIGLSTTLAVISITFMSLAPALLSSTQVIERARKRKSLFETWLTEKEKRVSTNKEIYQSKVLMTFYTDSIKKDKEEIKLSLPSITYVRLGFFSFCFFIFSAIWIIFGNLGSSISISAYDQGLHTIIYVISLFFGFLFLSIFWNHYWSHVRFTARIDERKRYVDDEDVQIKTTLEANRDGKWIDTSVLNNRIIPNEKMRAKVKFEGNIVNGFYDLHIRKESYGGEETWIPDTKTWLGKFGARINKSHVLYDDPDFNTGVIRGEYRFTETESYWDFNFPFSWGEYSIDIGVFDDPYLLPADERRHFTNTYKIDVFPEYQRYLRLLENDDEISVHHGAAKRIRKITYDRDIRAIDETQLIEGIMKYLREKYEKIEDKLIGDTVKELVSSLENIFRYNHDKPEKQEQLRRIFTDLFAIFEYWILHLDKAHVIRWGAIELLGFSVDDKSFKLLMDLIKEAEGEKFDATVFLSLLKPAVERRIINNKERISSIKELMRTLPREDERYEILKAILDENL